MTSLLICWKRNVTSQSTKINPCDQQCMVMNGLQHFICSIIIRECIPCLLLRLMCTLVHVHSSAAMELVLDISLSIWSNYSRRKKKWKWKRWKNLHHLLIRLQFCKDLIRHQFTNVLIAVCILGNEFVGHAKSSIFSFTAF